MQRHSRILVFGGNDRSKEMVARLFQIWEGEIRETSSAEECLRLIRGGESDLLVLGSDHPNADGADLYERISRDPQLRNNVPVFFLYDWKSQVEARIERVPAEIRPWPLKRRQHREGEGLSALLSHPHLLFCSLSTDGLYHQVNSAWTRTTGYPERELRERAVLAFIHPEDSPAVEEHLNKLRRGGTAVAFSARHRRRDGSHCWLRWNASTSPGADEIIVAAYDLSQGKWMEDQYQILSRVVEQSPVSVMITDRQGNIEYVNPKFVEVSGFQAEELIGHNPRVMKSGRQSRELYEDLWRTISAGNVWRGELRNKRKDGSLFWEREVIAPVRDADGVITHFVSIKEDITEQRLAEEKIRRQSALLEVATDAILIRAVEGEVFFWNKGAEKMYGWTAEEAIGRRVTDLIYEHEEDLQAAQQSLLRDGQWRGEMRQKTKDGKTIIAECRWTVAPDGTDQFPLVLSINTDITERKRLESQFLRAQRMESIGTLAGGIAHDLNNILGPILLSIDFLRTRHVDRQSERVLNALETSANRGADLVRQVLMFARGVEGERVTLQITHLIKDVVKILEETFPRMIRVVTELPSDVWPVPGDPTQLHQVLMNLCVNARDAMLDGGQIRIAAENTVLDEHYVRSNVEGQAGPHVVITVADTGTGIAPDVLPRIFDPFFTTKEVGKGTGIGLSTVRAIVKSHGGFLNVYSELGGGTIFKVYLPAGSAAKENREKSARSEIPRGNGELILVVDDEAAILEVTKTSLEAFGYRVVIAEDGTEGLAVYSQRKDEVKVVITDMMMPYLDGPATIRALRKIDPRVKVIAASGLEVSAKISNLGGHIAAFLPKPYTAERLLYTLAQVLAEKSA